MTSTLIHSISSDSEEEEFEDLASRIRKKNQFLQTELIRSTTSLAVDEDSPSTYSKNVKASIIVGKKNNILQPELIRPTNSIAVDLQVEEDSSSTCSENLRINSKKSTKRSTSINSTKPIKSKDEKRQEQLAKNIEKERLKLEKQQERAVKKASKPGECTKYMMVYIDRCLLESPGGSEIISRLSSKSIGYKVIDHTVPYSVTFYRQDPVTQEETKENESLVVIPVDNFIPLIYSQVYGTSESQAHPTICDKCQYWKKSLGHNLTFVVCGLDDYYKKEKTKKQRNFRQNITGEAPTQSKGRKRKKQDAESDQCLVQVNRSDVETALVAAQVEENVNHRLFSNSEKLADFVAQVTKSIAERPYKQEKQSSVQFSWYAEGSNTNCVKVDKSGVGLLKLWHQQLRQFNNVGIEVAQAIAKEYPSPQHLWTAYDKLSEENASVLLANIPVRRGIGILVNTRKIGPELSKKIYRFMTSKDPFQSLSQS